MDHAYIAENSLIERYHRGLLDPEEEARFEEHFFGCPECTEQIELARSFGRGMKAMAALAAEDAARGAVALGIFAWLARRGRLAQLGLALSALLILVVAAGLPALWLASRSEKTETALAAERRELASERQKSADLGRRLQASEAGRGALQKEWSERLTAAERLGKSAGVLADVPVFLLRTFRDEPGSPGMTIDLGKVRGPLSLAVDAPDDPRFQSYRVRLTGPGGRALFEQGGLHPNALEAVMVTFPAGFFSPGEYRLQVSGAGRDGGSTVLGSHPFRVVAR